MDIEEVIKLAYDLVFTQTGKHINDLQQHILREIFQGKPYCQIAKERNCTEGYVKNTASDLWKILSDQIGEKIRKSNLRATIERLNVLNFSNHNQDCIQITQLTLCSDSSTPSSKPSVEKSQSITDVGNAPEIVRFYGRNEELNKLKKWLLEDKVKIIAICGMIGIGKTTLARQLLEQIKSNFDIIIWRSLQFTPSLPTILKTLLSSLTNQQEIADDIDSQMSQLFLCLRQNRCLIILDSLEMLFTPGELAGHYQPNYQQYEILFTAIAKTSHQSCCLLLSREKPKEIIELESEKAPVRTLELRGMGNGAREILKDKKLKDEEKWSILIEIYQGNPMMLQLIVNVIQEIFHGKVSDLLSYNTTFVGDNLREKLGNIFARLSPLEKEMVSCWQQEDKPLSLSQLIHLTNRPFSDVINGLQSLSRRYLIETESKPETLYELEPIFQAYIQSDDVMKTHFSPDNADKLQ